MREREKVAGADAARTLEQLAETLERSLLTIGDVGVALAIVEKEKVIRDRVALQKKIVESLEAFRIRREFQLVRARIGCRAEEHEPVDDFLVEQIADGKMSAEHVLAEDPAVPAKAHALRIQHDLRRAAEVANDVAARRRDLLEEKSPIDVRPSDDGEIFNVVADEALVDDGANHWMILRGGAWSHARGCDFLYTAINCQSFKCVYFCVVDSDAWPRSS